MKIYYSRSNEVDDTLVRPLLDKFVSTIQQSFGSVEVSEHKRGSTYNPELVTNADMIVVGVEDMQFSVTNIAKGCYTEIETAFKHNIPVCVINKGKTTGLIQTIKKKDLNIQDANTWQIGYGNLCLYITHEGIECDGIIAGGYLDDAYQMALMMDELFGDIKFEKPTNTSVATNDEDLLLI